MTNWKDQPFALIGIHVGGSDVPQLHELMERERLTWRSFVDLGNAGAGPIAKAWNHSSTPTLYVLDHHGVIRHKWVGAPGDKVIDAALDKLIKEAKAAE